MGLQLGRFKAPWWALAVVASVVTMALAGTVVLVATPAGCRAANSLHVSAGSCGGTAANSPGPVFATPSVSVTSDARPSFPPPQTASPSIPAEPSPSTLLPFEYPASPAAPPYAMAGSPALPLNVTLACRLPIDQGPSGSGGFIAFPNGTYTADPRSAVNLPAGLPSPVAQFGGNQNTGITYDHTHARWLPVPPNWVAPDGSRYVYPGLQSIHVVSTADNSFTELGAGKAWFVMSVDAQGVYATIQQAAGLWYLPWTGAAQQIIATGYWQAVGFGAAWGSPAPALPNGVTNPITRLDLKTGVSVPWFALDGSPSQVVGFDNSGAPLIVVTSHPGQGYNHTYLWWVPAVGEGIAIAILNDGGPSSFAPNFPPISDAHGIWFGSQQGIFLFVPKDGWYLASRFSGQLAGRCT